MDITERKLAEEELRKLSRAVEQSPSIIFITDAAGRLEYVNPQFTKITGYTAEEAIGRFPRILDPGEISRKEYEERWHVLRSGDKWQGEFCNRKKNGEHYWESGSISSIKDENGAITHFVAVKEDITARKRAEEALAAERNLLRTVIDNLPDHIYAKDTECRFILKNLTDVRQMGAASPDEVVGKTDYDYYPPKLAAQYYADDQTVLQSGQPLINREEPITAADGTQGWILTSKVPLRDAQGKVVGLVGIGHDITERKRLEEKERDARVLAEALAVTVSALTRTLDLDDVMNTILENVARVVPHDAANIMLIEGDQARVANWRGYRPERIHSLQELRIPLAGTRHLQQMLANRLPFLAAYVDRHPDWVRRPHTEWVQSYIAAPIQSHGTVIGFLNVDSGTPGFFTEDHIQRLQAFADQASIAIEHAQIYEEIRRNAAELEQRVIERTAQLNNAKERIEAILNSSRDVMILCRTDSAIDQVNPAFDEVFKCTGEEIHGQSLATLAVPEQVSLLEQTFETIVQTRQPQRLEVTVRYKASATFDSEMMLSPVVGPDQRLFGVICSLRDITDRKKMEVQLRHMLEHEMQLSELKSRYVAMAAHDLRNPLAAIHTAVDIIEKYPDRLAEEQRRAKYDGIRRSIDVMLQLLNDILTVGQAESGRLKFEPGSLDLIAFCQTLAAEVQQAAGSGQQIRLSHQGACDRVHMDAKLLRHILGNLLSNALKYSPADSTVICDIQCESSVITFRIQDQGIGIPQADQAQLFEAFHRAGNVGSTPGTGLGLAIVKQSVVRHGGTITFESEEGLGTAFTVILPQTLPENRESS